MCWRIKTGLAGLFTGAVISTSAMSILPVYETHLPRDWIACKYSPEWGGLADVDAPQF